jgi:hypothetical protein
MVATLLVQMRTEITAAEAERRAQFGTTVLNSSETIVDLSSSSFTSTGLVLVNRSDLPALPEGGRVLAVVGAHIVEDEAAAPTDDASSTTQTSFSSSTTAHPIPYSEYASPLYQEDIREERNVWRRVSRLRRQLDWLDPFHYVPHMLTSNPCWCIVKKWGMSCEQVDADDSTFHPIQNARISLPKQTIFTPW